MSECILWKGRTNSRGYGVKCFGKSNDKLMHRVVYEHHHGPLKPGQVVMHTCDNRLCINPEHLQAGSQRDNLHDMYNKQRANPRGEGNPTNERNISINKAGYITVRMYFKGVRYQKSAKTMQQAIEIRDQMDKDITNAER